MFFFKVVSLRRFDVNYADHLVLSDERNCQLRADLRHRLDIFSIFSDVVYQDGASLLYGPARDPLAHLDANFFRYIRQMANLKSETQFLCALIEQQNRKDLVVDHALDDLSYAMQQRVQVQRGV